MSIEVVLIANNNLILLLVDFTLNRDQNFEITKFSSHFFFLFSSKAYQKGILFAFFGTHYTKIPISIWFVFHHLCASLFMSSSSIFISLDIFLYFQFQYEHSYSISCVMYSKNECVCICVTMTLMVPDFGYNYHLCSI